MSTETATPLELARLSAEAMGAKQGGGRAPRFIKTPQAVFVKRERYAMVEIWNPAEDANQAIELAGKTVNPETHHWKVDSPSKGYSKYDVFVRSYWQREAIAFASDLSFARALTIAALRMYQQEREG